MLSFILNHSFLLAFRFLISCYHKFTVVDATVSKSLFGICSGFRIGSKRQNCIKEHELFQSSIFTMPTASQKDPVNLYSQDQRRSNFHSVPSSKYSSLFAPLPRDNENRRLSVLILQQLLTSKRPLL